jgi:hypothetical protein
MSSGCVARPHFPEPTPNLSTLMRPVRQQGSERRFFPAPVSAINDVSELRQLVLAEFTYYLLQGLRKLGVSLARRHL